MTPERRSEIARLGGKKAHALGKAHKWNPQTASAAGRKGGLSISADRIHMASIGRAGGRMRHTQRQQAAPPVRLEEE